METFHRPGPGPVRLVVGLLLRLRAEITVLSVGIVCWWWLTHHLSRPAVITVGIIVPGLVMGWPVSRRIVTRRCWCVLSRHRMRAGMVQIRSMMNYSGWLPWMLWAHPTPVGERIYCWMRPGLCIDDLADRTEHIAVACWGRDARVRRSKRLAAMVIVDVIRRDPLTGRNSGIDSPLITLGADGPKPPPIAVSMGTRRTTATTTATAMTATAAVSSDTPDLDEDTSSARAKRARKNSTPRGTEVLTRDDGEDLSDYV